MSGVVEDTFGEGGGDNLYVCTGDSVDYVWEKFVRIPGDRRENLTAYGSSA
jgi:hypothetical protein